MKTAIIEVEEPKKFKPFKVEITIETEAEARIFERIISLHSVWFTSDFCSELNAKLEPLRAI